MSLNLTSLFSSGKEPFPTTPRHVKKWLKDLSLVNMGETTRAFYSELKQLNRIDLPAKQRLEVMELIRPTGRIVLDYLGKHLTARSLPLPPKSQKIGQLARAITLELATGYKLILRDVAQKKESLDVKRLTTATHRALRYLGSAQLLSARVYTSLPNAVWNDINQLYIFAEKNKLAEREIKDDQYETINKSSIATVYKQLCLFAISRPESLHLGEAQKLSSFYETAAELTGLGTAPVLDNNQGVFVVNLLSNEMPHYLSMDKLSSSAANRYLELTRLQNELGNQIKGQNTNTWQIVNDKATLSFDLARRLIQAWSQSGKRRFGRASSENSITTAIGLNTIYQAIEADVDTVSGKGLAEEKPMELSLQTIPDDQQVVDYWNEPIDHNDTLAGQPANVWDLVSSGKTLSDTFTKNQQHELEKKMTLARPESWQDWKIINTSAGGYCLLWPSSDPSKAQVGELIGLREKEGTDYEWRIGTIRWMIYLEKRGLEIGVSLLAPKTLLIQIDKINNKRMKPGLFPAQALMLPGIKTIQQQPTLILPSNLFEPGDDISFTLFGKEMRVILSNKTLFTSTFTQFRYKSFKKNQEHKHEDDSSEGFDSLWSTL